jgi:hypothetical protein
MSAKAKLKIQYKDDLSQTFEVLEKDAEKFIIALEQVTANEFILNGVSIDPKKIDSVWLHVFPGEDETASS